MIIYLFIIAFCLVGLLCMAAFVGMVVFEGIMDAFKNKANKNNRRRYAR